MIKQTDFTQENIRQYACLFFSLLNGISKTYNHSFTFEDINKIYRYLVIEKIMDVDCYVNDHEALLNHVIITHLRKTGKAKYLGAYYLPGTSRDNWGTYDKANHIILQFKTKNFSHFRTVDYSSYYPEPEHKYLMSVRYYHI